MTSLEKLIQADQYQALISRDTVLSTVVGKWPALAELDQTQTTMFYDFCSTLRELDGKLASTKTPLFVYAQPQNIHISVIQREKESVLAGGPWGDFYAPYASRLARMDACFGGFVQTLKNRKMYDDSVIILTADHGDSLGEEGRWGHAYTIYPEILRIPLIVHLPLAMRKRLAWDAAKTAFLTDIAPSLYYLLGNRGIKSSELFGRPLFTETLEEQKPYERSDYMVASSYAAVYGVLSGNGQRLYIADAANHRDYAFDLSGIPNSLGVTDAIRSAGQLRIRDNLLKINAFYRFTANATTVPPRGKD
jgi:arylsulfatase A-like enzyme